MKIALYLIPFLLFCTGCLLPKQPNHIIIESTKWHESQEFEVVKLKTRDLTSLRGNTRPSFGPRKKAPKNLLFAAVDETVQGQFAERLQEVYRTQDEIRLEDVSWWRFAPLMMDLYDTVAKIPYDNLSAKSLADAIEFLEAEGKPFDIILLTHGIPNHITSSGGYDLISYKDIAALPALKQLDMVFMQGCFSETLAPDWIKLGAKTVLSYEGWNRNFFYIDFFLPAYKKQGSAAKAFDSVNKSIQEDMTKSLLYKKILEELQMSFEEYFAISPSPILDTTSF